MNARHAKHGARLYRQRLGPLLRSHRRLQGIARKAVQGRLLRLLGGREADSSSWNEFRSLVDPAHGGSLIELERSGMEDEVVSLPDIGLLALAYGIPALVLDAARSKPVRNVISVHENRDFLKLAQEDLPYYGSGTQYSVPASQLEGIEDVTFLNLELCDQVAHTDSHSYPGEEFLFVDNGTVEVRFAESGLYTRLERGCLLHFDARQKHSVWNLSHETSTCFSIILYPKNPPHRKLKEAIVTTTAHKRPRNPDRVLDRSGLGRFLQRLCHENVWGRHSRISLRELANRAASKGYDLSRSKLDRIHRGEAPISARELPMLASIYDIEPILLYNFLLPFFPGAIAIHGESDMERINATFMPNGVMYLLPRRRLASSNIMIALVKIDPAGATHLSRSCGEEIVLPLDGHVSIEFGGMRTEVKSGQYAHFGAHFVHRLVNVGKESTTMLVLWLV